LILQLMTALLLAAGVLLYVWCLLGWFVLPFGGKHLQLVLKVHGDADDLERQLRALSWLRGSGLLQAELTIVDCGLSETGRNLVRHLRETYEFTF